jgi:hypothetical protein
MVLPKPLVSITENFGWMSFVRPSTRRFAPAQDEVNW